MQNALLKTLEEPSAGTILILLGSHAAVLPTVVSRCQVLLFSGSPKPAVQSSITVTPELSAKVTKLAQVSHGPLYEKLAFISLLAEEEPETLRDILLTWLLQERAQIINHPEQAVLLSRISEAWISLQNSFNKKMVLQRLLLGTISAAATSL